MIPRVCSKIYRTDVFDRVLDQFFPIFFRERVCTSITSRMTHVCYLSGSTGTGKLKKDKLKHCISVKLYINTRTAALLDVRSRHIINNLLLDPVQVNI